MFVKCSLNIIVSQSTGLSWIAPNTFAQMALVKTTGSQSSSKRPKCVKGICREK